MIRQQRTATLAGIALVVCCALLLSSGVAVAQSAENVTDVTYISSEGLDMEPSGADQSGEVISIPNGSTIHFIPILEVNGSELVTFTSGCDSVDTSITDVSNPYLSLSSQSVGYDLTADSVPIGGTVLSIACVLDGTNFMLNVPVDITDESPNAAIPELVWGVFASLAFIAMLAAVYLRERAFLTSIISAALWIAVAAGSLSIGVPTGAEVQAFSIPAIGILAAAFAAVMVLVSLLAFTGHWDSGDEDPTREMI